MNIFFVMLLIPNTMQINAVFDCNYEEADKK